MQTSPTNSGCCRCSTSAEGDNRRGFIRQAVALLCGGVALLVPAAAGVAAFLNPLRQKGRSGQFMRLTSLDVLPEDGTPLKIPVIADRTDAWNRFSNEPIGAVFVRRSGGEVVALQVLCPHAGCSINFEGSPQGGRFFCPCHAASFDLNGIRSDQTSPSPRDMDALDVEVRTKGEVWVKFQTFSVGAASKIVQG